tara:strand:- start:3515 stop:4075 length:561 start_codon:yes stop_codon:yes gene_type:complete
MLPLNEFTDVLNNFGKEVVKRAQNNLDTKKKNASGNLRKSLAYSMEVGGKEFSMTFDAPNAPYWEYVNYGVKGKISDALAPTSPFGFGTGDSDGGLTKGIRSWINTKPIKQWKSLTSGKFLSYDQMATLISRKVYLYGIATSDFYTDAFVRTLNKYRPKLEYAWGEDYGEFLAEEFSQELNFEIVL